MMGDGECAEGSVWEAMQYSSHYKLDNLCAIIDCNRLGQSEATALGHEMDVYRKRGEAFGWNTIVIDGHDVAAIAKAFSEAEATKGVPTLIVAQTYKGKHMPEQENMDNWHGKPMKQAAFEKIKSHLAGLKQDTKGAKVEPREPEAKCDQLTFAGDLKLSSPPSYSKTDKIATRAAYGTALKKMGEANDRVCGFDGDTKNSTFSLKFAEAFPERFSECFIAEQNLAGVAIGAACRNRTVAFASTFAAFWSRAFDQIRMGAISQTNANFSGSHVGCSIGEDGASQMALEDLAMFRSVNGSTVFYPSDAVSCERAIELAANTKGVCYIRTSRPNTPVIYSNDEVFEIGKCKVVSPVSSSDICTIVAGGITLAEANKAAATLRAAGKNVRVIDVFCVKPFDWKTVLDNAKETGNKIIVVEDHYTMGGIGEVCSAELNFNAPNIAFNMKHLCVKSIPYSGKPAELLERFEIDAKAIQKAVESF